MTAKIQQGDSVDFVAHPGESSSFDSFFWNCQISMTATDGRVFEADSKQDFSGPTNPDIPKSLDRLSQLAQTLLLSNEFAFVD